MNHLNTVLIEGNLTRDPKEIGGNSANPGCRFTIANNRYRLRNGTWEKETTFFPVLVFGRIGDACSRNLKRGRGVRVCGRLKQDFTKNGTTDTTYILAEHVEFQPERVAPPPETNAGAQNSTDQGNMTVSQGQGQAQGQCQAQGQGQDSLGNKPAYGQGYRQDDAPQAEGCVGNTILANATNATTSTNYTSANSSSANSSSANPAGENEQGPEAFEDQNSQNWDSSVPDVPAEEEAKLENLGKGVSAEEISELNDSDTDDQMPDCEPEY